MVINCSPLIIAHRGARREAPENTLPAFERAIELGADGIELDVLLTKDNVPVVTHNDDLSILTDRRDFIHDLNFSELEEIDFGGHFGEAWRGTPIPTLSEAIQLIGRHKILAIFEIKAQSGLHAISVNIIGAAVSAAKMSGPVLISSSSKRIVWELKRRYPNIPRAIIIRNRDFPFLRANYFAKVAGVSAIHPCLKIATPEMVANAHKKGLRVDAWTANTEADFRRCVELGVDGIISDDVALTMKYFNRT